MTSLRRAAALALAAIALGCAGVLAQPSPPAAEANVVCDVGSAIPDGITGGLGIGSPVGDACETVSAPVDAVTGLATDPLGDIASDIGNSIFEQITSWVADGATWLLGEVAVLAMSTTTPDLTSAGFLRQYKKMISVAVFMAALMLLAAIFEAISRGDAGMLVRVVGVNLPLAAIGASVAYLLVGLLVAMVDGLCEAVTASTGADTKEFFESAIKGLGGAGGAEDGESPVPGAGPAGAAQLGVPLFVSFIAAVLAAFAAFFIWVELLMRDAAVYAVSLFAPLGLAAGIWPRWRSVIRRTAELIFVVVFSKFVIVSIIALAASLLAKGEGSVEQVLAAGALLLVACFSPLMLMRFVPIAEAAVAGAYAGRRSAAGTALRTAHEASFLEQTARRNWSGGDEDKGVRAITTTKKGAGTSGGGRTGGGGSGGGGAASGAASAGASGAAGGGVAAGVTVPVASAKAASAAAERLQGAATSGAGEAASESPRVFGQDKVADRFPTATSQREQGGASPAKAPGRGGGEQSKPSEAARPLPEKPPRPPAAVADQPRPKEEKP